MPEEVLQVLFDPSTGAVKVGGTENVMGNQVLAFGMLRVAEHAIIDQMKVARENRIVPATQLPPGFPGT